MFVLYVYVCYDSWCSQGFGVLFRLMSPTCTPKNLVFWVIGGTVYIFSWSYLGQDQTHISSWPRPDAGGDANARQAANISSTNFLHFRQIGRLTLWVLLMHQSLQSFVILFFSAGVGLSMASHHTRVRDSHLFAPSHSLAPWF